MKRSASKTRETSETLSEKLSGEPVELSAVREEIKNLVGNAAVDMVKRGIAEANKGHYAAMKFLFELAGLNSAAEVAEPREDEGGLAKALFDRLGVAEAGPEVTNVLPAKSDGGSDAVE